MNNLFIRDCYQYNTSSSVCNVSIIGRLKSTSITFPAKSVVIFMKTKETVFESVFSSNYSLLSATTYCTGHPFTFYSFSLNSNV